MKATGIVRRIDDLGRIVIPKETRRTMRIRKGDLVVTYLIKANSTKVLVTFVLFFYYVNL